MGLAAPARSQSGGYGPSISNGEIAGVIAGTAAVLGVGGYLIYRAAHKQSIQGCVVSDQNGLSLTSDKDKRTYVLMGNVGTLTSGQHVALSGKKLKGSDARPAFQVRKLHKNLGACSP
jgi:hypothetical protein